MGIKIVDSAEKLSVNLKHREKKRLKKRKMTYLLVDTHKNAYG